MAAFSAVLGGSITLTLTLADGQLSEVLHNLVTSKGHRSGLPRPRFVDRNAPRTISGTFQITGSSKDNAISQIAAINALVRDGSTLALQSTDATCPVALTILPSALSSPVFNDAQFEGANRGFIPFSWTIEPYAYGAEQTVINNAAITAPCIVDTSTVKGDFATPLWVYIDGDSVDVRTLYLAIIRNPDTDIDDYVREAEALTWAGGTAAEYSSVNARGGKATQNTGNNVLTAASVTDSNMPAGTHLLLARQFVASTKTGQYLARLADATTVLGTVTQTVAGWRVIELCTASMPTQKVLSGSTSTHQIAFRTTTDATASYWDYYAMLPLFDGWASYAPPNDVPDDQADLTLGYDGIWYDEAGVSDMVNGKSGGLMAAPGDRLLVIGTADADTGGTLAAALTVKAVPRYALWA